MLSPHGKATKRRQPRFARIMMHNVHAGASEMSDAVSTPTAPAAPSGELRQVTALFADMVGFTAISEQVGEEGTFALIQPI